MNITETRPQKHACTATNKGTIKENQFYAQQQTTFWAWEHTSRAKSSKSIPKITSQLLIPQWGQMRPNQSNWCHELPATYPSFLSANKAHIWEKKMRYEYTFISKHNIEIHLNWRLSSIKHYKHTQCILVLPVDL